MRAHASLVHDHEGSIEHIELILRARGDEPAKSILILDHHKCSPRAHRLLERFGSVEAIMRAGAGDLCSVPGIGERIAGALRCSVEERRCDYRSG